MSQVTTHTNCREVNGITVGLIDGIIAMARVIRQRDLTDEAVLEALADLRSDEDIAFLFNQPLSEGSSS